MRRRRRRGGGGWEGEDDDDDDDDGEILGGMGTDDGDEYFCSLKVHRLMTQTQRRTRDKI